MDLTGPLLDSWDRQCRILAAVASKIDESNRHSKPSEDGMPLDHQLAHIHKVRHYFLSRFAPKFVESMDDGYVDPWVTPIDDLDTIKSLLLASGAAVRQAVLEGIENGGGPSGGYDNPVVFLQHITWHEGWHVGLIFLGLRLAGQEPAEEWEEQNVWGQWRVED